LATADVFDGFAASHPSIQGEIMTTVPNSTTTPLAGHTDVIIGEIKGMVGDANERLIEAGHSVAAELAATRHAMSQKACGAADATYDYVRGNPWKIVGLAAVAGLIIGTALVRR
jgi:ElaB/YqjD/DUF883 family membrane-anchored ribosome-binding protein